MKHARIAALALAPLALGAAQARTALTPQPVREDATLHLSPSGYHLVNETRRVGLLKGTNLVSFSWKNVQIEDGSLILAPMDHQNAVRLIGLTYPPNESGAVLAEVYADRDVVATFRVSYLLRNLERQISYTGIVEKDGKRWRLQREGTVFNRSGERFEDVTVNMGDGLSYDGPLDHPEGRKVIKETDRSLAVDPVYRLTLVPMQTVGGKPHPLNPELRYRLVNDERVSPTKDVLSYGKLRLFQEDSQGTQAFTGEDRVAAVAFGQTEEVRIGGAQDVRVKWFLDEDEERNVTKAKTGTLDPDTYTVRADRYLKYRLELQNFKDEKAGVWVTIPTKYNTGVKVLKSTHPTQIEKDHTSGITVKVDLPPGGKEVTATVELLYPDYIFKTR